MGPTSCTSLSTTHHDIGTTLPQQPSAKKHPRRLHQQSPHAAHHPRLRPRRSQPSRNTRLLIHLRIPLHAVEIREHSSPMIIPLHSNHRPSILSRQLGRNPRQLQRPQPLLQLRTLQSRPHLNHLHRSKITIRPTTSSIHCNEIFLAWQRRQPNPQSPAPPNLHRLTHFTQPALHRSNLKAGRRLPRVLGSELGKSQGYSFRQKSCQPQSFLRQLHS